MISLGNIRLVINKAIVIKNENQIITKKPKIYGES